MKKQILKLMLVFGVSALCCSAFAVDLVGVYKKAVTSDPTFRAARSQWLSDRENIAISRSGLLPSFDINGGLNYTILNNTTSKYNNKTASYGLSITQPLFNYEAWSSLKKAKSQAKSSAATYSVAAQDLMVRTAQAYFNVLEAKDLLRYTLAEKRSIYRQLEQTNQRYKVGLIAVTGVYQAQAQYDLVLSEEIAARNDLANKKEQLREITGEQYSIYAGLRGNLPLIKPNPNNIEQWVDVALKQNYQLLADRYTQLAAQENINTQSAARFPTLSASGGYAVTHASNIDVGYKDNRVATAGLSLGFPVLQGGAVSAKTRQAEYDYQTASANLEKDYRGIASTTRQSYLGVMSGISKIQADKQAIVSNQSALKATEAEYVVGTQTMVDVLKVQSDLYAAQKNYASDQYAYLLETLRLKQAAGTLSTSDLQKINTWLKQNNKNIASKKIAVKKTHLPPPIVITDKKTATKKAKTNKTLTSIEKHILSINPKHYTIQIMAAHKKANILNFANKYKVPDKIYILHTYNKGKDWYELITGEYKDINSARRAVHTLPKGIKKIHPWIRSYASVHKAIK